MNILPYSVFRFIKRLLEGQNTSVLKFQCSLKSPTSCLCQTLWGWHTVWAVLWKYTGNCQLIYDIKPQSEDWSRRALFSPKLKCFLDTWGGFVQANQYWARPDGEALWLGQSSAAHRALCRKCQTSEVRYWDEYLTCWDVKATELRYQGTKEMSLSPGAVTVQMVPLLFDRGCWHTRPDSIRPTCVYDPTGSITNIPMPCRHANAIMAFSMPILPCLWKYILLRSH